MQCVVRCCSSGSSRRAARSHTNKGAARSCARPQEARAGRACALKSEQFHTTGGPCASRAMSRQTSQKHSGTPQSVRRDGEMAANVPCSSACFCSDVKKCPILISGELDEPPGICHSVLQLRWVCRKPAHAVQNWQEPASTEKKDRPTRPARGASTSPSTVRTVEGEVEGHTAPRQ